MKILKAFLILVLAGTTMAGCKKDDNGVTEFVLNNENLAGLYELVFFQSITVETTNVNGLDVVSTTTRTGDTFQVDYVFSSNGTYTADGLYRIVSTVVVNGQTTMEDAYIESVEIQNGNYGTSASSSTMAVDGVTYDVTVFNESEVQITLERMQTFPNGDTEVYSEELRFLRK